MNSKVRSVMGLLLFIGIVSAAVTLTNESSGEAIEELEHSKIVRADAPILPLEISVDINLAKAKLGQRLFSDQRLSQNNSVSCQTCHNFEKGGADGLQFSTGVNKKRGQVNSPSIYNSKFNFKQFWDGRAEDLSSQIEGPVHNPVEFGTTWDEIESKLNADSEMRESFYSVYKKEIRRELIVDSIVEFERALITVNAPFDRYLRGESELTVAQTRGYQKFNQYGCIACHQGRNVGGNMFQTMGVAYDYFKERGGSFSSDLGRFAVTKEERDRHVFKVPSLRNVELTAPYFHDGSEPSLEGAVRKMARYQLGRHMPQEDVADIVEFLKSLTGEQPAILNASGYETAQQ